MNKIRYQTMNEETYIGRGFRCRAMEGYGERFIAIDLKKQDNENRRVEKRIYSGA